MTLGGVFRPLPTEVVDELIPWVASDGGFPAAPTEVVDELIPWVASGGVFRAGAHGKELSD